MLNHLRYQALNRAFGVSREQANVVTAIVLLGAPDGAYEAARRIAGIRAMEANTSDYMEAFTSPAKKSELQAIFEREARRLIDGGADVIVPTGGIPMMLFGKEPGANVDGAPIVNGVTVVIKAAEMAVKLKRLGVSVASRIPQSGFALPSAQTLEEFLRHG